MTNALGDMASTQTLLAEQLGTKSRHITTAYIDTIVPPPVSAPDTLQEVCDTGNTTNTDVILSTGDLQTTTGKVLTDEVSAIAPNRVLTLKTYIKSLKVRYELSAPMVVIPDEVQYGYIVQIRSGTAPSVFTMPRAIEGGHFTLINSSGNGQRVMAAAGERLDTLSPPSFISLTATAPFAVECRAGAAGEWWLGQY